MSGPAFQDLMGEKHCFGCGPDNPQGLQIKSFWDGPEEAVCTFHPQAHHPAQPIDVLYGGLVAALIDCHSICTANAHAYRIEGRAIGSEPQIRHVTGALKVKYLRPAPIAGPVEVRARIAEAGERKTVVASILSVGGEVCVEGEAVAVRVPSDWGGKEQLQGRRQAPPLRSRRGGAGLRPSA